MNFSQENEEIHIWNAYSGGKRQREQVKPAAGAHERQQHVLFVRAGAKPRVASAFRHAGSTERHTYTHGRKKRQRQNASRVQRRDRVYAISSREARVWCHSRERRLRRVYDSGGDRRGARLFTSERRLRLSLWFSGRVERKYRTSVACEISGSLIRAVYVDHWVFGTSEVACLRIRRDGSVFHIFLSWLRNRELRNQIHCRDFRWHEIRDHDWRQSFFSLLRRCVEKNSVEFGEARGACIFQ